MWKELRSTYSGQAAVGFERIGESLGTQSRCAISISGVIRIDGEDVRRFTLKSLRQHPVWQNIAYGKPEAARAEVIRAARLANADEFIERLPQGYDTVVGERGETLSGGQRQRIAIARATIRDTPIRLLDEPSTGLDAASEQLVFEALGRLMKGKTSVVIAHRLATVRRAEVIPVVADGSIAQRGTHAQLLALGSLYRQLYEIQFKQQDEGR